MFRVAACIGQIVQLRMVGAVTRPITQAMADVPRAEVGLRVMCLLVVTWPEIPTLFFGWNLSPPNKPGRT